jgi:hypothetical protein
MGQRINVCKTLIYKFTLFCDFYCNFSVADPGWAKNQYPGSGSGKNNPNQISQSFETIFGVKILKISDADPGWKKFESGINIPDPQHL